MGGGHGHKLIEGLALDAQARVVTGIGDLFTPFSIIGGIATVLLFMLHGANCLLLRLHVDAVLHSRAKSAVGVRWPPSRPVAVLKTSPVDGESPKRCAVSLRQLNGCTARSEMFSAVHRVIAVRDLKLMSP